MGPPALHAAVCPRVRAREPLVEVVAEHGFLQFFHHLIIQNRAPHGRPPSLGNWALARLGQFLLFKTVGHYQEIHCVRQTWAEDLEALPWESKSRLN